MDKFSISSEALSKYYLDPIKVNVSPAKGYRSRC